MTIQKQIDETIKIKRERLWNNQNTKLNEMKRKEKQTDGQTKSQQQRRYYPQQTTHFSHQNHPWFPNGQRTELSVQHIIADCLKYNQDRIKHKISHNLHHTGTQSLT